MIHTAADWEETGEPFFNIQLFIVRISANLCVIQRTPVCSAGWTLKSKATLNRWIFEWSLVGVQREERGGRGKETNSLHSYSADQSILNNHIYDVDNGAVQTLSGQGLGLDRVRVLWKMQPVAAMMEGQLQQ